MDSANPDDTFLVGVLIGVVIVTCAITLYHIVKHEINLVRSKRYEHR